MVGRFRQVCVHKAKPLGRGYAFSPAPDLRGSGIAGNEAGYVL